MGEEKKESRIPPPAFPPGSRKHRRTNHTRPVAAEALGDGFISPEDPLPERSSSVDEAFISPDEPLPHRELRSGGGSDLPAFDVEEAVVTGIGDDAHLDPIELVAAGDPHVMELIEKVGKLAEALRTKGEAGLKITPEMDRFESTLRGYCVGYLAGRRAEDDPSAVDF